MEENNNHKYGDAISVSQFAKYMDDLLVPDAPSTSGKTKRPSRRSVRYSVPNPSTNVNPSDGQVKAPYTAFDKKKLDDAIASITPSSQDYFYIPENEYEYIVYGGGIKDQIHKKSEWMTKGIDPYESVKPSSDSSLQKKLDEANALIEEYQSGSTYKKGQESVFQALLEMEVFGMSLSTEELVLHLKEKLNKKDGV